jgi:hypothetical protein
MSSNGEAMLVAADHCMTICRVSLQVEFYFSDANLPTDKHLLKQIHRDPEGYGEISVVLTWCVCSWFLSRRPSLSSNIATCCVL